MPRGRKKIYTLEEAKQRKKECSRVVKIKRAEVHVIEDRNYYLNNKEHCKDLVADWKDADPFRKTAAYIIAKAKREGLLIKGPCEFQDVTCSKQIEYHIEDYEYPLENGHWVCKRHHHLKYHSDSHAEASKKFWRRKKCVTTIWGKDTPVTARVEKVEQEGKNLQITFAIDQPKKVFPNSQYVDRSTWRG